MTRATRPLEGVRVVELTIAVAGPTCGKYLAHFGAEVIKLESRRNPDILRTRGSAWLEHRTDSREVWTDTSPAVSETMAGKLSLGLDLKRERGAEVARRLIARSDVFISNYAAPAVARLGFDYDSLVSLRRSKPGKAVAVAQGVYPCRGRDRWVAITVTSEDEWRALCGAFGRPELAADPRFRTLRGRLANHDALDVIIGDWSQGQTSTEASEALQHAGVPASPVVDTPELARDVHLQARDFWLWADSARLGRDLATGNPVRLTATPGHTQRAGPSLGEHNDYVLSEVCGYRPEYIEELVDDGTVFPMAGPEERFERRYLSWVRHLMPDVAWDRPTASREGVDPDSEPPSR